MKKKLSILIIFLFIFSSSFSLLFLNNNKNNIINNLQNSQSDNPGLILNSKYTDSDRTIRRIGTSDDDGTEGDYIDEWDFTSFYWVGDTPNSWVNDSGSPLTMTAIMPGTPSTLSTNLTHNVIDNSTKNITDINTMDLYQLNFKFTASVSSTTENWDLYYYFAIYYSDGTYELLKTYHYNWLTYWPDPFSTTQSFTTNLTTNKYVTKFEINQTYTSSGYQSFTASFYLKIEDFLLKEPLVTNFDIYPIYPYDYPIGKDVLQYDTVNFELDIYPNRDSYIRIISFLYNETETNQYFNLTIKDLFDPIRNYFSLKFNLTGLYFYQFKIYVNNWIYVTSDVDYFYVKPNDEIYPKNTYVTLWSPFSDLSLTGTLKMYLGEDEQARICDFDGLYSDRGTNLTWYQFIAGTTNNFQVANKRMYWETLGGSIRAVTDLYYNLTYYDTLSFRLKIKDTSIFPTSVSKGLYIIQNPSTWDSDYRLDISSYNTSQYLNTWIQFFIPWKLFSVISGYNEFLGEIGFYSPGSSGLLDCEIRDIFIANYNNLKEIINNTEQSFTTNTTTVFLDSEPRYFEISNSTPLNFAPTLWTSYDNIYQCTNGFNNSQSIMENISVINNETIQLDTQITNETYLNNTSETFESNKYVVNETTTFENFTTYFESSENTTYGFGNINITENEGIYQAEYNFKDDSVGSDPSGWTDSSGSSCSAELIDELDGHKNVYELTDGSATYDAIVYCTISPSTFGYMECWYRTSDVDKCNRIYIVDGNNEGVGITFALDGAHNGYFQYYDYAWHDIVGGAQSDTWYHLKFLWNIGVGWYVWIDGTQYGVYSFRGSPSNIDNIRVRTVTSSGYNLYFDAMDFDTSSNYYTGRNMNQEANFSNAFYISNNITIKDFNVLIQDVNYSSESQQNSTLELQYYDFNTNTWVDNNSYIGTSQNELKFKTLLNTTAYTNSFLYNITLTFTNYIYNFSHSFVYTFTIDKDNITSLFFNLTYETNQTIDLFLFSSQFDEIYSLPNSSMDYYLTNKSVIWKFNKSIEGYGNGFYLTISQRNISIEYNIFYTNGSYLSRIYDMGGNRRIYNLTYSWNDLQNFTIQFNFANDTGPFTEYYTYSNLTNPTMIARYFTFRLNLSTMNNSETPMFYNLNVSIIYYKWIIYDDSGKFDGPFDLPQDCIVNWTLEVQNFTNANVPGGFYNFTGGTSNYVMIGYSPTETFNDVNFQTTTNFSITGTSQSWNNPFQPGYFRFDTLTTSDFLYCYIKPNVTFYDRTYKIWYYPFSRSINIIYENLTDTEYYAFSITSNLVNISDWLEIRINNTNILNLTTSNNDIPYVIRFSDLGYTPGLIENFSLFYFHPTINETDDTNIELSNVFLFENNTYRLLNEDNRQFGNTLVFTEEIESLLMVDYYNDQIYREILNRSEIGNFLDIEIPFFTFVIKNNYDYAITIQIEKDNVIRTYLIPEQWSLELAIIMMDYSISQVISNVQTVQIYSGVLSRTSKRSVTVGQLIPLEEILSYSEQIQQALGENWYENTFFLLILAITPLDAIVLYVYNKFKGFKISKTKKKLKKRGKGFEEVKEVPKSELDLYHF